MARQLTLELAPPAARGTRAQGVKVRPGKRRGTVYVRTKSGNVYRFRFEFTDAAARRVFMDEIKARGGRINTRHWSRVA